VNPPVIVFKFPTFSRKDHVMDCDFTKETNLRIRAMEFAVECYKAPGRIDLIPSAQKILDFLNPPLPPLGGKHLIDAVRPAPKRRASKAKRA